MKKFFTLILLSMIAFNTIHAEITWTLSNDGTLTISGGYMDYYGPGNAPWYFKRDRIKKVVIEKGVTSIGEYAFWNCKTLTSIYIPESVIKIGDHAFDYCSSLTSITIPSSVTSIGKYVFQDCPALTTATIGMGLTNIQGVFSGCSNVRVLYSISLLP